MRGGPSLPRQSAPLGNGTSAASSASSSAAWAAAACVACPLGTLCPRGAARPLAAPGFWIVEGAGCAECGQASAEGPAYYRLAGRCYQCPDDQRFVLFIVTTPTYVHLTPTLDALTLLRGLNSSRLRLSPLHLPTANAAAASRQVPVLFVALFAVLYRSSARKPSETLTTLTEAFAFHPECNLGGNALLIRWSVMALSPFLFGAACVAFAGALAARDYFHAALFTHLCSTALEPFACVEAPDGTRYLASEPSVLWCARPGPGLLEGAGLLD
eukprot:tig00021070_g17814.t1